MSFGQRPIIRDRMPVLHAFVPVMAVGRESVYVFPKFLFFKLADILSVALANVDDHNQAYRRLVAGVYCFSVNVTLG